MRDCLLKLAMCPCWMLFLMVFIMAYGISVNSTPVEKFLCDLNTWNGCNFPDQFGFYCTNTKCPVSEKISIPIFFGGGWGGANLLQHGLATLPFCPAFLCFRGLSLLFATMLLCLSGHLGWPGVNNG